MCEARINTASEGKFCDACGSPVHVRCAAQEQRGVGSCGTCGVPAEIAAAHGARAKQEEDSFRRTYRSHRLSWGIVEVIGGPILFLFGMLLLFIGGLVSVAIAWTVLALGATTTLHGLLMLLRAKPRGPKDDR